MELVGLNAMDAVARTSTRIISDTDGFLGLADHWNKLLKRSGTANVYLSHEWLYAWWHRFARERSNELYIVCVYLDQALVAIAPFYIQKKTGYRIGFKKTLRLLGQSIGKDTMPCTERLDIITDKRRSHQGLVYKTLHQLLRDNNEKWSQYYFQRLTSSSMLYQLHGDLAHTRHDSRHETHSAFSLNLVNSFEGFLQQQTKNWRSVYRGHNRMMQLSGDAEFRVITNSDEIHAGLQSMAQLMCAQQRKNSDGHCIYDSDQFMAFHNDICHYMSLKKRVKIVTLIMGGRLLGSVYLFECDDVVQVYQLASVQGDGIRFYPGLILLAHIVRMAIAQGKTRLEFRSVCGDLMFKKAPLPGGELTRLYNVEWYRKRHRAYVVKSARRLCLALRSPVK